MKLPAFILLCLFCAGSGLALGRYAWAAPDEVAPVTRPSSHASPEAQSSARSIQQSLAELRSGPRRAALLLSLAARSDRRQLPALIEHCAHDAAALHFLADTWLHSDPDAFVRAIAASKAMRGAHRLQCEMALWSVLERWGKSAPDDAWHTVESLPGPLRRQGLSKLAAARIEANPRAGLEFLRAHPAVTPGSLDVSFKEVQADLLPLIQALPECPAKGSLIRQAVKDLPLAEAMEAVRHRGGMVETMACRAVLREAADHSLEEVTAFHASASGPERYLAAHVISDQLLDDDPAAAVTWAQDHLSGNLRTAVIKRAAENLEASDPAAAAAALRCCRKISARPASKSHAD